MKIHIVKKGDTLYELAKKYHVELDKLIAMNPQIVNPDQIDVGMKVKIPSAPKPLEPSGEYTHKHVVKQGDTLWKLSKAWDVPLAALIAANPQLKNPNVLMTGEIVYIPKLGTGKPQMSAPGAAPFPEYSMQTPGMEAGAAMPPYVQPPAQPATEPVMPELPAMPMGEFHIPPMETPQWTMPESAMPSTEEWAKLYEHYPHHTVAGAGYQVPSQEGMPLLSEPFAGVSGTEAGAVHPFTQYQIPATEAFASQSPEMPEPPHDGYMPGSMPHFHAGMPEMHYPLNVPQAAPGFQAPAYSYPHHHAGDCGCHGPKLGAFDPWAMSAPAYADPQSMTYFPAAPLHTGAYPDLAHPYYPVMEPALGYAPAPGMPYSYAYPPVYPEGFPDPYGSPHAHVHKLEETEKTEDIDIDLGKTRKTPEAVVVKPVSKRSRGKNARTTLSSIIQNMDRRQTRPEPKQNLPWINV